MAQHRRINVPEDVGLYFEVREGLDVKQSSTIFSFCQIM
jgi:hypothetical protein